jgi:two-component system sensor histidine kinase TctE
MIGEIVGNLLDNAINHNAPGGSVIVRIGEDRLTARIEIEDDGPGIPDEERGKVFERFYRVNRRDAPTGSGLGLAIVRALADRLGASITLRAPQSGRGLLATVRLRRAISK